MTMENNDVGVVSELTALLVSVLSSSLSTFGAVVRPAWDESAARDECPLCAVSVEDAGGRPGDSSCRRMVVRAVVATRYDMDETGSVFRACCAAALSSLEGVVPCSTPHYATVCYAPGYSPSFSLSPAGAYDGAWRSADLTGEFWINRISDFEI